MSIWTFVLNLSDLNIHITIKKIYIEIMPKYHSASKILFYHLPTRGRAGIKLGDAWYVSNVSIIFDCSMLLYYPFWMFMGFTLHFYIIFGINLLTRGPARIAIFLAYFSVSKKRNIKRSPNGMKPSGELFLERKQSRRLGVHVTKETREARGGGTPTPLGAPSTLVAPLTYFFLLYIPIYPKTFGEQNRSGVPPPQASVATKNQSGPCSGTLPEGESLTGSHLHHPGALHDEEGVVHPRGWGYVPVAMCLISLSLSCSWFGTILMYRELCYYSWILWCFSPSTLL